MHPAWEPPQLAGRSTLGEDLIVVIQCGFAWVVHTFRVLPFGWYSLFRPELSFRPQQICRGALGSACLNPSLPLVLCAFLSEQLYLLESWFPYQ